MNTIQKQCWTEMKSSFATYLRFELAQAPCGVAPSKGVQKASGVHPGRHDLDADVAAVEVQQDGSSGGEMLHAEHAGTARQKVPRVIKCVEPCRCSQIRRSPLASTINQHAGTA